MNQLHPFRLIIAVVAAALSLPLTADEQRHRDSQRLLPAGEPGSRYIDLNTADLKTLEAEPVIGPELARAIIAARPFTTIDDLDRVKDISAERLEQIRAIVTVVPRASAKRPTKGATAGERPAASAGADKSVDINTADVETLAAIPVIGAETARAIVAARPFRSLYELSQLEGMSAERLEQIRAQVTVVPPPLPETSDEQAKANVKRK